MVKNKPVLIGTFVRSLIRIMANEYHLLGPKYIVRFMHIYGLGDPVNESYFSTFIGLNSSVLITSKSR